MESNGSFTKFQVQVSQQTVFSGRLVVQAFFRIVVDPIFDEGDFFGSRFLGSFRQPSTNEPIVILISSPIGVCIVDMLLRKYIRQAVEFDSIICRDGKNVMLS